MSWGPFSAEAVTLDGALRRLHREGRTSDAIAAIKNALDIAHRTGPSNMTYAEFEAACSTDSADPAGKK
jgi:hypothetical protein